MGEMNGKLGKAKFNSLRILLYYGERSYNIMGKLTQKFQNKIPSRSIEVHKEVISTLPIQVKYKFSI